MKPEIREFIGNHQLYFESMGKEKKISNIGKNVGVSVPAVYSFLESGVKYGVIKKEGKNVFFENIGNFAGIYVTDKGIEIGIFDSRFNEIGFKFKERHGKFQKHEIIDAFMETKKEYQFLYAAVVVDSAVKDGEQIEFGTDSYNIFTCPDLLSAQDCVVVNSTIIKIIYIRQFINKKKNLLYYNLRLKQFSIIEDNQLKERTYDEYYGILPHFKDENDEVMQRLFELKGEEYDEYYQKNKEKLYSHIVPDIRSMLCMLRPDIFYIDGGIIKPQYIVKSNISEDIDKFCFHDILGRYNMYVRPICFIDPSTRELLKVAAAKYAKYKFLNWKLIW